MKVRWVMIWNEDSKTLRIRRADEEGRLSYQDLGKFECKGIIQQWCSENNVPFWDN